MSSFPSGFSGLSGLLVIEVPFPLPPSFPTRAGPVCASGSLPEGWDGFACLLILAAVRGCLLVFVHGDGLEDVDGEAEEAGKGVPAQDVLTNISADIRLLPKP